MEQPLLYAEKSGSERWSSYEHAGRTGSSIPTASLSGTEVSVDEIRSAAAFSEPYPPSLHAPLLSTPDPHYDRLFNRHKTIHEILGGGSVADVVLWRQKNLSLGILVVALTAWVVFEISGYTLLTLVSSVFLLLFTILFLWAKSAAILNRPPPPLPHLYLSEETVNEVAALVRDLVNVVLSVFEDVAHGRDLKMFIRVSLSLLITSVVGRFAGLFTLCCTCLVLVLTIPALYVRYEDHIDKHTLIWSRKVKHLVVRFDKEVIVKVHKWILEKRKLS